MRVCLCWGTPQIGCPFGVQLKLTKKWGPSNKDEPPMSSGLGSSCAQCVERGTMNQAQGCVEGLVPFERLRCKEHCEAEILQHD